MDYFGDESGHLKGVLQGDCEVCVMAIVGGDRVSCGRCPKKTVRNITDVCEAKWNDLLEVQKRRLFECFSDSDHLEFGFATFNREQLESLDKYHLLYQDVNLPPTWDLALAGYAYGEILFEMGADDDTHSTLTFDRISSKTQSQKVADHVTQFVSPSQVFIEGSRKASGIQAADCLAGGVAEDIKRGTDWLSYLNDDRIIECSHASLIQLENDLTSYSTAP